ncbi:MAG: branched-chain amino acid ABC transporter permease [Nitriliruptorales bacterium]|nr:branched-chain amino acid ABC transporter permease [Nitriliruptorales bacterium]
MNWEGILGAAARAAVGRDAVVFCLAAIGLNMHFGYTGLLNFGQAGFMAIGAYGLAVAVNTIGLPMWIGLIVGLAAAVVLALLLGVPTLRLRADYLAIVTIAAAEILRLTFRSVALRDVTGGSSGLTQFARDFYTINPYSSGTYGLWLVRVDERVAWVLTVGWGLVILLSLMMYLLMHSPWGRVIKSIREDEDAARSLGKNVYFYKMQSLILGGVIGAIAGFITSISSQSVQPDTYSTPVTFFAYVILILGGTARIFGPIAGAMIFWALLSLTNSVLRAAVAPDGPLPGLLSGTQIGQVRFVLVGVSLMLLMIFRPQGIFGDRKELALDER